MNLIPNCPSCIGFAGKKEHRPTAFTLGDGIVHVAPDMWLASRASRIKREQRVDFIEASRLALHDYAFGCELEQRASGRTA